MKNVFWSLQLSTVDSRNYIYSDFQAWAEVWEVEWADGKVEWAEEWEVAWAEAAEWVAAAEWVEEWAVEWEVAVVEWGKHLLVTVFRSF